MWDPSGKSTTDKLELTCNFFIFAVYLVEVLMMDEFFIRNM
jgi:hypothetical protein